MLFLNRRVGETVVIGEEIFCTVLGFENGQVRLAFDAPPSLPVHRNEIQQKIWRERKENKRFEDFLVSKESVVDRLISQFKPVDALKPTH